MESSTNHLNCNKNSFFSPADIFCLYCPPTGLHPSQFKFQSKSLVPVSVLNPNPSSSLSKFKPSPIFTKSFQFQALVEVKIPVLIPLPFCRVKPQSQSYSSLLFPVSNFSLITNLYHSLKSPNFISSLSP